MMMMMMMGNPGSWEAPFEVEMQYRLVRVGLSGTITLGDVCNFCTFLGS